MSKPISFGFGKQKSSAPAKGPILPARKTALANGRPKTALRHDSDNEDEEEPRHESVTGFSSGGAILSQPVQDSEELVIKNAGNSDWRRRGRKNLLPDEVQAQQQNGHVVVVERDEVSTTSGLQLAETGGKAVDVEGNGEQQTAPTENEAEAPHKDLTADEEALQALLDDGSGKPKSNAVIVQQENMHTFRDETTDYREDVASRPDSSTLEEYAAMPVEEFGMAMLRGMGQKRRANGEVINFNPPADENPRKLRKQEGFLGIGAKPAPGTNGVELGAWGKADMRKNNKGQGFFTPLMRENKATGERISEDELQKRMKESKGQEKEEDWRQRRDRNLERSGRDDGRERERDRKNGDDDYRDQMNSSSRSSSSKRDADDRDTSRSRRDKDDRDYDVSRSRRDEDRSKDRRRRDDGDQDSRHRDRHKDRERYRDHDRYDSSSSHRSHRDRDRDRDRDKDRRDRDRR
ncbi:DNA primase large subunit Spp2 [Exophiala xenobiotica]|nr:DNA primase large subunit Spp2 [Exophiala xenobiotica]KAK5212354.1 DNA primase large subunit Spp2 [Exophiala xenobiotica]KAK5219799.1 DNA primase large subunit Spp2 [Exophiala xenobiotica]KAK5252491.1 DNA primase large subunit Spp2 [Exophiala xenobiotica]KAK5321879.1 DNA primase large subunit Spp2 [Exophiala xenobiotica]